MEEYNLQEIRIEDYNIIKEYYQMRRPETADSNILDLYIWLNCYPTWYFTNDKGLMWVAKSEDGQYYSSIPCCKDEDLKECFLETQKYFNEVLQKKLVMEMGVNIENHAGKDVQVKLQTSVYLQGKDGRPVGEEVTQSMTKDIAIKKDSV